MPKEIAKNLVNFVNRIWSNCLPNNLIIISTLTPYPVATFDGSKNMNTSTVEKQINTKRYRSEFTIKVFVTVTLDVSPNKIFVLFYKI